MKSIKHALLGLALATCATVSAFAAPANPYEGGTSVMETDSSGAGLLSTFSFGLGDAAVKAGQTFSWDFLLLTPPADPTIWFGFLLQPDNPGAVAFDNVGFFGFGAEYTDVPGFTIGGDNTSVVGFGWLDSGVYDLYVSGTFLADGAGFSGFGVSDIVDPTAAVPEPMSLALMGLGLAGLAGARRRRKAEPAAEAA